MHLILTGATGLVGSAVLRALLLDSAVTRISILSRRPVPLAAAEGHGKAEVILHADFLHYPAASASPSPSPDPADLRTRLASATGVVWALGTSQAGMSTAAYTTVTHAFPLAFVRWWAALPLPPDAPATERTFVYVSGHGTTHAPGRFTALFAKVKGEAERELLGLTVADAAAPAARAEAAGPGLRVYAPRPAAVDPRAQAEIHAWVPVPPWWQRGLRLVLFPVLDRVYTDMLAPTRQLGEVCVGLAKGTNARGEVRMSENQAAKGGYMEVRFVEEGEATWRGGVVENKELRRLGGL